MARLGDVCTIVSGSTPSTTVSEYWDGEIKWITPAELDEDSFYVFDSVRHITEYGKGKTGLKCMPAGTVILSSRAPIGKTAIAGCEMCCNQGFKNLICSDKIYNEYLYFFLKAKSDYLNSLGRGATFKELSKSIVENIEIPLPPYEVQKRVAMQMRKIVSIMTSRKQQLSKLDELVKSRFIELFGACNCRISTFGKEFSFISRGKSPSYVELSDLAVINQACIYWNGLNFDKVKYNDVSYSGDRILQFGDVLVNSTGTGTLGRANIFMRRGADKRYMADSHVTIIRGSVSCHPVYIKCYLEQAKIQDAIYRNCVSGSTNQIELSKEKFKELELPVPPMTLQQQFAAFVEQTDKSKFEIQQSLEKLETLKKALMQKYFG